MFCLKSKLMGYVALYIGFKTEHILNSSDMLFHPAKVPFESIFNLIKNPLNILCLLFMCKHHITCFILLVYLIMFSLYLFTFIFVLHLFPKQSNSPNQVTFTVSMKSPLMLQIIFWKLDSKLKHIFKVPFCLQSNKTFSKLWSCFDILLDFH